MGMSLSDLLFYDSPLEATKAKLAQAGLLGQADAQSQLLGGPRFDQNANVIGQYQSPQAPQTIQNDTSALGPAPQSIPGNAPMRYASQVSVPGLLGTSMPERQQDYDQGKMGLLGKAYPDVFGSSMAQSAALNQRLDGSSVSPVGKQLLAVDPSGKLYGSYIEKTNELTPQQKVANALQSMAPDDPRRPMLENWLNKEGGIETDANKVAETKASIAEKQAQAALAGQRSELMKSTGLDDDTINMRAQMWAAGDHSGAFQGIPNSIYGSTARAAISQRGAQLMAQNGLTGADAAASGAEFFGTKAGERTLGTRSANIEMAVSEAQKMGDIAQSLSDQMPRGSFMPINKAVQSFKEQTGDPVARSFGGAVNSFLNAYATAVGKGTMTVEGRRHAEDMLSKADSPQAFKAIMSTLQQEMAAARQAPHDVRSQLRGAITGQAPAEPAKVLKYNPQTGKIE